MVFPNYLEAITYREEIFRPAWKRGLKINQAVEKVKLSVSFSGVLIQLYWHLV